MKKWVKQHLVLLYALLCIAILVSAFISISASASAGNYEIRDIEGSSRFLDGIKASMVLKDSAHVQSLTLSNGKLKHEYEYIMPINERRDESIGFLHNYVEHEDADVIVTSETNLEDSNAEYDIYVTQLKRAADKVRVSVLLQQIKNYPSSEKVKVVQVITNVTAEDASHPFEFNYLKDIEYSKSTSSSGDITEEKTEMPFEDIGMKVTNKDYTEESWRNTPVYAEDDSGMMYFSPKLQPVHGGQSAIYRVDEWNTGVVVKEPILKDGHEYHLSYLEIPMGSVTEVVTFSLEQQKLRTVKLDVVDNRLCLLLVVDGMLTLRVYSMDGELEQELALFEYNADSAVQSVLYTNKSGSSTMLCYKLLQSQGDENFNEIREHLFCVELNERAQLRSVIAPPQLLLRAAYVSDRWVLISTERYTVDNNHPEYSPSRYYISVLEDGGQRLYLGEIVTDAWEDEIQFYLASDDEWSKHNTFYIDKRTLSCEILTEEQ